ncbi:MAG: heavy metal transporter [Chloroflexi bacterium RBG_16_48_8]|nr:MAG: heavy metal transporter [Chloroflexi bacterium RBG_16_48_8]
MTKVEYFVPNISCGHCVHTIKMEIGELAGVSNVEASQDSKKVIIEFDPPATEQKIESVLVEINYPPKK